MAGNKNTVAQPKRTLSNLWISFVLLAFAALVLPTTLLLIAGMVPTLVAYIIDRDPEKLAAVTVGSLNFSGIVPFLVDMWLTNHSLAALSTLLSKPLTWLIIYGAAAVGWAFYFSIPPVVAAAVTLQAKTRITRLQASQQTLLAEWGPDVVGR